MWKRFHLCFPSNLTKPSSSPSPITTSSDDPNRPSIVLINNFNLLYDGSTGGRLISDPPSTTTFTPADSSSSSTSYNESYKCSFAPEDSPPPDITAVFASSRFFFSSPGRSNSITESSDPRPHDETATATRLLIGGTAVKQYVQSPDPYIDFRRSMEEMLDSVTNVEGLRRYEFLHELLLSYLSLNAVDTHKFIIRAFAAIVVSHLSDGHRIS